MPYYLWIVIFLIVLLFIRRERASAVMRKMIKNQKRENAVMKELAKRFIGEECIIYTITSLDGGISGVIRETTDGGIIIEKSSGETEAVNLDYVTRIRQYPRKKNGKKKNLVI